MGDEIYVKDFIKSLPPGQLGQFEPVSGLILIDFTTAQVNDFVSRDGSSLTELDRQIPRTINHEVFHFAQTVASGYMYRRQHAMFEIFASTVAPEDVPAATSVEEGGSSELERRARNVSMLVHQMDRVSRLRANAPPGDNSLAGALNPQMFEHLRTVDRAERRENAAGLSTAALIEGAAAVHAEMLLASDEPDPGAQVRAALAGLPAEYRTLHDLTAARFGDHAMDVLLPAAALALRYTQPHEAYLALAGELLRRRDVAPLNAGRELLRAGLPRIGRAGPLLGTAGDQHVPTTQFSVYRDMLSDLTAGTWGVDAYALLADPRAMPLVPSWPVGVLLSDGTWLGDVPPVTLAARVVIMSAFLRVKSRIREERDFEQNATQWLEDFSTRWFWNG
jgi:hypothetical protein